MTIIWTPRAASDLEAAINYICGGRPEAVFGVSNNLYNHVLMLSAMPQMGRIGALPGTRELVFNPWPFIAVYRVSEDAVRILRVRHAAQQWPPTTSS